MDVGTVARPVRVLVMEDHERMRAAMVAAIADIPTMSVVAEAGSVRDALVLVARHSPDVAVLDVRMPDGSGIDVCRTLERDYPQVRCIIISSHEDIGTRQLVSSLGAARFVLKTTRVDELIAAISDATGDLSPVP